MCLHCEGGEILMHLFVANLFSFGYEWHSFHVSALLLMHESLRYFWCLSQMCFLLLVLKSGFQCGLCAQKYTLVNITKYYYHLDVILFLLYLLFRRLAKSTLLLIPLFGINYVVFVYIIDENEGMEYYKIFFDLGLGSFQVRNMPECSGINICQGTIS